MNRLENQVCVVTGGGSGVGKAIAAQLLQHGAKVVIAGRDAAKLEATATELGAGVLYVPTDVSDAKQCQNLIQMATDQFGRVDVLINNAGANLKARTVRELTPESWDQMIGANLHGAFYCIHAVLPQMLERKAGLIINIVSVAGKRANPLGGAAYVAAKHGMGALGTVLANEEKESGIRISNIFPGEIDTPILVNRPRPVTAEQLAVILKPEDVASAVLFVANCPPHVSIPELVIKPTVHQYW